MKTLWFKNKEYGWGWVPVTKEGWFVTSVFFIAYLVSLIVYEYAVKNHPEALDMFTIYYLIWVVNVTVIFIAVCYKTGEKPGWHWKKRKVPPAGRAGTSKK